MKPWLIQLVAPWIVFVLPWTAAAYQRRWGLAACLGILWVAALACAARMWFGPGVLALVLLGFLAVVTAKFNAEGASAR